MDRDERWKNSHRKKVYKVTKGPFTILSRQDLEHFLAMRTRLIPVDVGIA